jgi:hypothetical protein
MPSYVYSKVDDLEGTGKVGSKQCVVLVQHYTKAPQTSAWKQGSQVKGLTALTKGTAVATFEKGVYPNRLHDNHAALYISQDASGITVMDQWADDKSKPSVSKRVMRFKGKSKDGKFLDPSNNADALYVIN